MNDSKLWKIFSEYIRLRDSDENGNCKCFTCGLLRNWKQMDCGHGIGRQHKFTKFMETNNHAQCKKCNGFEGGRQDIYKQEVDKRYGAGTWDKMEMMSKMICKRGQFDVDIMTGFYRTEVQKLKHSKGIK